MKNLRLMAIVAAMGGYIIPLILIDDSKLAIGAHITFGIFGILVGLTVHSPFIAQRSKTVDGSIASIGVSSSLSILALLFGLIAVFSWFNDKHAVSYALDVASIVVVFFLFGLGGIVSDHVDDIVSNNAFTSDHFVWRNELLIIKNRCNNSEIESCVDELIDAAMYLTKDPNENKLTINKQISEEILKLRDSAVMDNIEDFHSHCQEVRALFNTRELRMADKFSVGKA